MTGREQRTDFMVLQLNGEAKWPGSFSKSELRFSIEPADEKEEIDQGYVKDLVEEAIMDAFGNGKDSLEEIGDSVVFSLQEEGFIVRDFPNEVRQMSFDVAKYRQGEMER